MNKRLLTLLLAGTLIMASLAGCGSTSPNETPEVSQTQEETSANNADAEATSKAAAEEAAKKAEEAAKKAAEEAAAKEAEANEYYEAGRASLYGLDGTEINLETAYNNFLKAAELGKNDANFYLGVMYDDYYNYLQCDYHFIDEFSPYDKKHAECYGSQVFSEYSTQAFNVNVGEEVEIIYGKGFQGKAQLTGILSVSEGKVKSDK